VRAFEERWSKQAESELLVTLRNLGYNDAKAAETKGGWCAQLSRSIDSNVNDFKQREEAQDQEKDFVSKDSVDWSIISDNDALLSRRFEALTFDRPPVIKQMSMKKGRLVETSIHKTNIHQIRRAKHFIYIESQYFMGSSFMWGDNRHVKCGNLIAAEVALKICEKIAAREPFAVYILLPMWMEGNPAADATQGLLYFQRMTIEALYKQVDDALNTRMATSSDSGLKVSDYLNLYCLGTRETAEGSQATAYESKTEDEKVLKQTRRHQIYIHSKMMIVDDDVVQVGTANINQRSMDGCRDSEIMMTAWQPDHLATDTSIAKSDIHAYRMHIWASLTGEMHDEFRNPSSKECVKVMNAIAQRNWATYIGKETVDMKSHLLPFPLDFVNGKITPRIGLTNRRHSKGLVDANFPDTNASVLGKKSLLLPELLLT
jgi:phospholipase D1/2